MISRRIRSGSAHRAAFIASSGKNMGIFKGVGYPEEIAVLGELKLPRTFQGLSDASGVGPDRLGKILSVLESLQLISVAGAEAPPDLTSPVSSGWREDALAVRVEKNATPGSVKQKTFEYAGLNGGAWAPTTRRTTRRSAGTGSLRYGVATSASGMMST
jgi:hypothetical protein